MKYIRTKDHFEELYIDEFTEYGKEYYKNSKIADTIEKLCDEFVFHIESQGHWVINNYKRALEIAKSYNEDEIKFICYGAIWTEWGLKYVAKMNLKGELELL